MKKTKILLICIVSSLLTGIVGYIIGINYSDEIRLNKQEKNIVGTYKTTTWNGKDAALVLDKDKTCIYPSGSSKCTWKVTDNNVIITINTEEYKESYIEMYLNEKLSSDNISILINLIKDNSGGVNGSQDPYYGISGIFYEPEDNLIKMYAKEKYIDTIVDNLKKLPTLKDLPITFSIKSIEKHIGGTFETKEDIDVRIVDKGLMLYGHFFEKVK